MKNKKWIVTLTIALVVALGAGVTIYGSIDMDRYKAREENAKIDDLEIREDAPKTQEAVIDGKVKDGLVYSETKMLKNGEAIDVYLDRDKNEFRYQTDGRLVGYYNKKACSVPGTPDPGMDEKSALELANKHVAAFYPDSYQKYTLSEAVCRSSDGSSYRVSYAVGYGVGGFIRGDEMYVTVGADGKIMHSACNPNPVYENFDASLLADATKEELNKAAAEWVKTTFGDKVVKHQVREYKLVYENDRYAVRVNVDLDKGEYVVPDLFYYELG